MWFRKKAKNEGKLLFSWVECVGCGCLMREARKEVEVRGREGSLTTTWHIGSGPPEPPSFTESYCGRCAPAYDVRHMGARGTLYYRKEPAKSVEVTEKGKTIKEQSRVQARGGE